MVSGGQKNICTRKFLLQGILGGINRQDTSYLDCKYKHMMKNEAPPDISGILLNLLSTESFFDAFSSFRS